MHAAQNKTDSLHEVAQLGDEELIETLRQLLCKERRLSARLLVHLAEVDARGLYRQYAYSSMFDYCVQALHLSEAEAYLRIRAARLSRQFPRVLQMMAQGELHLSAIKLLAPVLSDANCEELLAQARHKSKRELELLLAQRFEKPDVPSLIRRLPQNVLVPERAERAAQPLLAVCAEVASASEASAAQSNQAKPSPAPRELEPTCPPKPSARPILSPLGPNRYKVQLTASKQLHDKLRQAQDLMRHQVPDGDLGQIVERALDLLIAERMKRRFGKTNKPRRQQAKSEIKPGSLHIPYAVRRDVLARDGARCSYVSADGKRCDQRGQLELHHEQPQGRGGPSTTANIRMLCRAHNQLLAEYDYGRAFMQQRIQHARSKRKLAPGLAP
jgi:5-methylcytosine-specific restriction endonuclease McrA